MGGCGVASFSVLEVASVDSELAMLADLGLDNALRRLRSNIDSSDIKNPSHAGLT